MSEATTTNPTKPAVFTIGAVYEGFPVTVQVEGKAESLQTMVTRLKQMGATPPTPAVIAPRRPQIRSRPSARYTAS